MTDGLHIARDCVIPTRELELRFSRSGGPGGQNVNVRDTKVEVVFDLANSPSIGPRRKARAMHVLRNKLDGQGRLHVVASEERTQARNRTIALERLAAMLSDAVKPPPPPRRATRPSRSALRRKRETKGARSAIKRARAWRPDED